jgi:beta-lactamase class A
MSKTAGKKIVYGICLLTIGVLIGFTMSFYIKASDKTPVDTFSEHRSGGYKYINPLYECSNSQLVGTSEYRNLETKIRDFITRKTNSVEISQASVYFRDLNNGPWIGINEKADFSPSSLLKLPVMLAFFKRAETDPLILSKVIVYDKIPQGDFAVLSQDFAPKNPVELGKKYTIKQLIEHMIENSDNTALSLLEQNIPDAEIDKVTLDLGIPTATDLTPQDYMNVKDYSALFRVLFNASYLSKALSQKALEILSKTEFNDGIRKQVPGNISIAHKFGEREFADGTNQLHDCGIIYYPNHPYLLCVMTRGAVFANLAAAIQDISGIVYKEVDNRYKNRN